MASVASAAIIEGSLIIGLDDGSIINCGFVQGPQGLKGDPGPMGATGDPGLDGNTIHTVAGTPRNDMGRDGDYAIDNVNWRIYGPKSGGVWGKAKSMLPDKENLITNGREGGGSGGGSMGGSGSGGGDGGPVFTTTVIATGSGRLAQSGTGTTATVSYPGSPNGIISPEAGMNVQANINAFFVKALEELEVELPVATSDGDPGAPKYDGKLWFDTDEDELTLYVYYNGDWVPAAPPVSLDGIENAIANIDAELLKTNAQIAIVNAKVDDLRLDIDEGDFRPNLEQVLEQGNIADKSVVLTNAEDDAILLSPEDARIMVGGIGPDVVPRVELRHETGVLDTSIVKLELDEDGERFDIECDEKVDNIHFRFENDVKFELNKTGDAEFNGKVKAQPGAEGNELVTYEQIASLAGEIDEIKDEKEKGEWKAELPSTGSEGGREVLVNAETFPEAQGGSNMMQLKETGGDDGFGQLGILIDPGAQDAENQALQTWLKNAAAECTADPGAFKDKYSFFCPQAEELGFAVRNQPIHSIEDPSLTTFNIKFYGKPNTPEKQESIVGVEFFQEGAEGHRPPSGFFYMEAYQDKATQEAACQDAYTNCLTGDPSNDSNCLRDLDTCMLEAADGFKPVTDFGEATALIFHKTDCKQPAVTHSFDEVRIGDSINITDRATGHFIVAEIDAIQEIGDHIRFTVDTVSHSGGIIEGNKCAVEFYDFNLTPGGPDLENYVKKSGDTMTGKLTMEKPIWIKPEGTSTNGWGNHSMLIVNQQGASSDSIVRIKQDGKDKLKVMYSGHTSLENNKLIKVAAPEDDTDGVNKQYVDEQIAKGSTHEGGTIPANLVLWEYIEGGKDAVINLSSNQFTVEISGSNLTMYVAAHAHGRFYVPGRTANYSHEIGHTYITINEYDSSCVLGAKATKLWLMQKESQGDKTTWYNAVDCSYYKAGLESHPLVAGRRYVLSLPSPFPLFAYSRDYFLNGTATTQSSDDSIEEVAPDAIDLGEIHP